MHLTNPIVAWARTTGLQVILIVLGTVLAVRLAHWAAGALARQVERRVKVAISAGQVPSEQSKHVRLVIQACDWGFTAIIYFVAAIVVLVKFNLPLASLVAPATVIGVGLGFGAQRVVQDLLAGVFLFAEHQYGFGDSVRIGQVGATTGVSGTVEEVTLRTTALRTSTGELVIIPNGQIPQVTNLSRGWSRAIVDLPLALDQDLDQATAVLEMVGDQLAADEHWSSLLLDTPQVTGIEAIAVGYLQLRIMVRTVPTRQGEVSAEIRRRAIEAFRKVGIAPPPALFAQPPTSGA